MAMDSETESGDESGDEENETWEGLTARQRAWNNCGAFIATILVIVAELMSEQNLFGMVIIGGTLTVLNVLITASSLDKAAELEDEFEKDDMRDENNIIREETSTRRQALDMTSIDVNELPVEDDRYISHEDFGYMLERTPSRPCLTRPRAQSSRWRCNEYSEVEEVQPKRPQRPQRRTRSMAEAPEDDNVEERHPRGNRDMDARDRKRRTYKQRREKYDRIERRDKYWEGDKRERRSRDKKSKRKKRVTIAPGSEECIVIGET